MIKVRAKIKFDDYKEKVTRNAGDVFLVTQERYNEILTNGGDWVEEVEEIEEVEEVEEVEKVEKEKSTNKRTPKTTRK